MPALPIIQPDLRLPRYEQLRELLKARIVAGEWPAGSALPAETELAREYGVALGTMRQAIALAVEEGLLERVHGKGTFVRSEMHATMFRFFRFRGRAGEQDAIVPRTVIHDVREAALEPEVAARLQLGRARRGIFLLRTRVVDDVPALLERIWLPYQPFKRLLSVPRDAFGDLLYPFYREQCNIVITRANEEISFGVLDQDDAVLLGMTAGEPVAVINRTAFSLTGEPVEFRVTQGDAKRFHYNVEIK